MKKIISILCVVVILVGLVAAFAGCEKREEVLKLYVPGQYIDEDIFEEFEAWYKEQTGLKVKVKVEEFEEVEDIQLAVEGSKADYDLICPSDYMVEYLIANELVQKVDKEIIDVTAEGLFKAEYLNTAKEYDPTLEYSVPYMYGTLGLVYDYSKTNAKITSWEALFGDTYSGTNTRSVKDSIRDAYAAACLYNARATLTGLTGDAQKTAVQAVFEDLSDETIAAAKTTIQNVKSNGGIWDVDNVKFDMAQNNTAVKVALMWSCDAGYVMNEYEDDDGNVHAGNRNLWYVVPDEGGNIYMDNFCIGKYAVNTQAANYFLKFLCTKDIAVKNSEYAGAVSPVAEAYDELYDYYMNDEDEIFVDEAYSAEYMEEWKAMYIETMFPSAATLNRCGVMKDLGDRKNALNNMWSKI